MNRFSCNEDVLGNDLLSKISDTNLLVVGAGGIGCELLKNVALAGFKNIEVIDLDTIDATNLNRQFLFQKEHVGMSKAQVARESVLKYNPNLDIIAHHDDVFSEKFNLKYFESFDLVMNALDNLKARNHVNRMCLAANIPLIESGSSGYLGQVAVIKKGVSECYECHPKPPPKQYPACTIRNTPSTLVHCVVWAKFLFRHIYGDADAENDVAPKADDPEAIGDEKAGVEEDKKDAGDDYVSTRNWVEQNDYDPLKLLVKLFHTDVNTLLSMNNLWTFRDKPRAIEDIDTLLKAGEDILAKDNNDIATDADIKEVKAGGNLPTQRVLSLPEIVFTFFNSARALRSRMKDVDEYGLVFDKDDEDTMNFVYAASNIRAYIFHIDNKSLFDVKSIAGNIIPAIATTNAVVAGLIVNEAFKIIAGKLDTCKAVYVSRTLMGGNSILSAHALHKPNPKCYVCSSRPTCTVHVDIGTTTLHMLAEEVLKGALSLIEPSVSLSSGKEVLYVPEDDEEKDMLETKLYPRLLSSFEIIDGSKCTVTDDRQGNFRLVLIFRQWDEATDDVPFKVLMDNDQPEATSTTETAFVTTTVTDGKRASDDSDEETNRNTKKSKSLQS
eukprot:m.8183 g.8183  ORF g.8183 m.8183 type:complete len:611 (-) comp3048_c0_seq1:133-1965(-)